MTLTIIPFKALPCELETFRINGINADKMDFGESKDHREEVDITKFYDDTIQYGCCNNYFTANSNLCKEAMKKYKITEDEFEQICDALEAKLDVGVCGWCV